MNEKLEKRMDALVKLGDVLRSDTELEAVIEKAASYNPWFTPEFCRTAIDAITERMLTADKLNEWLTRYEIGEDDKLSLIHI